MASSTGSTPAARLTLRANTVDVFLDTPGRERGGWLCDSFWTARAARLMFGDTRVERAMLENFLAPTVARHFDGYSPAVYPAGKGSHLPNWTMFLILQLHEFYRRTVHRELSPGAREGASSTGTRTRVPPKSPRSSRVMRTPRREC